MFFSFAAVFVKLNNRRRGKIPTVTCGGICRAVALLTISLGILAAASERALAQAQVTGQWVSLSYPMPINPIHVGLVHTGKVLVVAGSENDPTEHKAKISKAAIWDLGGGDITQGTITRTPDLTWDVFCNGWAFFRDGRCLVIGGTSQYDPFYGEPRTTVFDPLTEKFSQMQYMAHGRWYATGIVLPDGRIMAFSGLNETGVVNNTVEFYMVGSGWSSPFTAPYSPNLYPWAACPARRACLQFGRFTVFEHVQSVHPDLDGEFCENLYRLGPHLRKLRSAATATAELCRTRDDPGRWRPECYSDN